MLGIINADVECIKVRIKVCTYFTNLLQKQKHHFWNLQDNYSSGQNIKKEGVIFQMSTLIQNQGHIFVIYKA